MERRCPRANPYWANDLVGASPVTFTTSRVEGTDFYLNVEGENDARYSIWNSQAWIFPDGHSGYGPYVLIDENVRKIFIQNGSHGVVDVVVYEQS